MRRFKHQMLSFLVLSCFMLIGNIAPSLANPRPIAPCYSPSHLSSITFAIFSSQHSPRHATLYFHNTHLLPAPASPLPALNLRAQRIIHQLEQFQSTKPDIEYEPICIRNHTSTRPAATAALAASPTSSIQLQPRILGQRPWRSWLNQLDVSALASAVRVFSAKCMDSLHTARHVTSLALSSAAKEAMALCTKLYGAIRYMYDMLTLQAALHGLYLAKSAVTDFANHKCHKWTPYVSRVLPDTMAVQQAQQMCCILLIGSGVLLLLGCAFMGAWLRYKSIIEQFLNDSA